MANIVSSGLFGDGASAVVMVGAGPRPSAGVEVVDARSALYPDTLDAARLGHRRQRLPDRAVAEHRGHRRGAPRRRRRRPARRAPPQGQRRRHVGRAHRRPADPGVRGAGARASRRGARGELGVAGAGREPVVVGRPARARRRARARAVSSPARSASCSRSGPGVCAEIVLLRWPEEPAGDRAMTWYTVLVLAVGVERLAELVVAQRHATWAFAHGGVESGKRHYPPMVALHTGLLVACLSRCRWPTGRSCPCSAGPRSRSCSRRRRCAGGASRRSATCGTPGSSWSPASRWCTAGPYRWLRHPNYVAVAVEGAALPLVHTAWVTALAFTVLNAILLLASASPPRSARCARRGRVGGRMTTRRRRPGRRRRAGRARRGDRGAPRGAARHRRRAARDARSTRPAARA